MTRPSPASSMASPVSSMSPTSELWSFFLAVRWYLTSCLAHLVEKSGLRVASSPTRSLSVLSCGLRQGRDGAVRDVLPVHEQRGSAVVEEEEAGEVDGQVVEYAVVERTCCVVGGEDVEPAVADVCGSADRLENS